MKDINKLYEIYSDKEAMKYRGSKPFTSLEDAKVYVKNKVLSKNQITTIRKGVELKNNSELLGSVMYRFDEKTPDQCEIGYSIGKQYWGQGLGKEIVSHILQTIKERGNIKTITAWSNKENIASIKILESHSFSKLKQDKHPNQFLFSLTII